MFFVVFPLYILSFLAPASQPGSAEWLEPELVGDPTKKTDFLLNVTRILFFFYIADIWNDQQTVATRG